MYDFLRCNCTSISYQNIYLVLSFHLIHGCQKIEENYINFRGHKMLMGILRYASNVCVSGGLQLDKE